MGRLGAFLKNGLGGSKTDRAATDRVKEWSRAALAASDDTVFAVTEIVCRDPGCPGLETVILVMQPGIKTRACKVAKGLSEITEPDVVAAFGV